MLKSLCVGLGWSVLSRSAAGRERLPAVGSDILRWDGKRWRIAAEHPKHLVAFQLTDEHNGWAVGQDGIPYRFTDGEWSELQGPRGGLHEVFCSPDGTWLVGETLWRLEGSNWRQYPNPTEHSRVLYRMTGRNGKAWAVGVNGAIAHFDGRQWSAQSSPEVTSALRGVSIAGPNDVWAVGERGVILHYDGKSWRHAPGPAGPQWAYNYLHDVHFLAPDDGWAVGTQGTILHYDGKVWSLVEAPTDKFLLSVHFRSPNDGWAAGGSFPDGAVFLHYDGRKWALVPSPTPRLIQDLCCLTSGNYWALASAAMPVTTQR